MTGSRHGGGCLAAGLALCLGTAGLAAGEAVDSAWDWSGGDAAGWAAEGDGLVTNAGGRLETRFEAQTAPALEACLAWIPVEHSVLVTNVAFRLYGGELPPSAVRVQWRSRYSGETWYRYLEPPGAGEWADYALPMRYEAGWTIGPRRTENAFRHDCLDIDLLGLLFVRNGATLEQHYGLDDARLQGLRLTDIVDPPDDADGDGMPDAWEARHGLLADWNGDRFEDEDDDGLSNYAEYRAGTDPTNSQSRFLVELPARGAEPFDDARRLQWDSVRYRSYTVWRSTNLVEGFQVAASNVFCTPPRNEWRDAAATNAGPYFYRLQVED